MKIYSTATVVVTTVRRAGFYPSTRQALFLSRRLCYVLGFTKLDDVIRCADFLRGSVRAIDGVFTDPLENVWTSAEKRAATDLSAWWSADEEDADLFAQKAYFVVDLNTGRSLCVVSK